MELTITEFARLGGKARWKKTKKAERSKLMSELAKKRVYKPRKTLSTSASKSA